MKANIESVSDASVWDIGYFPRRAAAATCGIGVRPRVASCVSMPVPCTAQPMVQGVLGLRRESRRGRRGRVPEEHFHPRVEQLLRRLHARTLESRSPASQPVRNYLLFQNVPGGAKRSQPLRTPSPVARKNTPASSRESVALVNPSPRRRAGIPCLPAHGPSPAAHIDFTEQFTEPSDDSRRPIVLDQRSPSYHHMRCYRPPPPTSRLARSRSPAR